MYNLNIIKPIFAQGHFTIKTLLFGYLETTL